MFAALAQSTLSELFRCLSAVHAKWIPIVPKFSLGRNSPLYSFKLLGFWLFICVSYSFPQAFLISWSQFNFARVHELFSVHYWCKILNSLLIFVQVVIIVRFLEALRVNLTIQSSLIKFVSIFKHIVQLCWFCSFEFHMMDRFGFIRTLIFASKNCSFKLSCSR